MEPPKDDGAAEVGEEGPYPRSGLLGFEMMDEPVKVRGEVASEKEDEKDRWRGLEMESGSEGGMSGVGLGPPPKALETKDVELARWCDIENFNRGSGC